MYLKVDTGLSNDGNSDTRSIYPDVQTPDVSDFDGARDVIMLDELFLC